MIDTTEGPTEGPQQGAETRRVMLSLSSISISDSLIRVVFEEEDVEETDTDRHHLTLNSLIFKSSIPSQCLVSTLQVDGNAFSFYRCDFSWNDAVFQVCARVG